MKGSGGETEAAAEVTPAEGSLSGAHGEGSQGQGSRSSAGAAGSAPTGAAAGSTDKGEKQGSAKEKPQDTLKRLSNLKKKGQGDFWQWLEPVLITEVVNKEEVQVCKLKCVRGEGVCGKLLGTDNPSRFWSWASHSAGQQRK